MPLTQDYLNFLKPGCTEVEIQMTWYKDSGRVLTRGHLLPITMSQGFELSEDSLPMEWGQEDLFQGWL